jgi:hypothetical protein
VLLFLFRSFMHVFNLSFKSEWVFIFRFFVIAVYSFHCFIYVFCPLQLYLLLSGMHMIAAQIPHIAMLIMLTLRQMMPHKYSALNTSWVIALVQVAQVVVRLRYGPLWTYERTVVTASVTLWRLFTSIDTNHVFTDTIPIMDGSVPVGRYVWSSKSRISATRLCKSC